MYNHIFIIFIYHEKEGGIYNSWPSFVSPGGVTRYNCATDFLMFVSAAICSKMSSANSAWIRPLASMYPVVLANMTCVRPFAGVHLRKSY